MAEVELTEVLPNQNGNSIYRSSTFIQILPLIKSVDFGIENNAFEDDCQDAPMKVISNDDNSIRIEPARRVTYIWSNINVWIGSGKSATDEDSKSYFEKKKPQNKVLLKNVSGIIRPGELVAVIGASGAGKSTLMDVLTFRNSSKLKVSGQRAINGTIIQSNTITSISAYVQQQDLFIGVLTVREHLIFQSKVRMDADVPYDERMKRVEVIIREFGLEKCANTRIGTKWFKGISGGEMRRLSIATEVLTDPLFMCCDEPTSGLDSTSASRVLETLKNLANKGKTVLCAIHQPSSQFYALFDRVIYMCEGRIAYLGPTADCLEFFSNLGYTCPERHNPADFIIEVLTVSNVDDYKVIQEICDAYDETPIARETKLRIRKTSCIVDVANETSRYKASWFTQFMAVLHRSWVSYIRDPMVLKLRILQTIILGVFVGMIYFKEEINHFDGIQNVSGAIFMLLCSLTYQNVFVVLDCFCSELPVFLREHFNGMYRSDVYFISKLLVEIPFYIMLPTIFSAIAYWMVGFDPTADSFIKTTGILILITYICSGLGYFLSCLATSVTVALILAPVVVFPFFLFGGFLVRPGSGVVFLRWLQHISWFFYGYESIAIIQFEKIDYIECGTNNATCPPNGLAVLASLNFNKDNFNSDILALVALGIGSTILSYMALFYKTIRR